MPKIEFVEMAQKLMAKEVILEPLQDPKRLAEDILAEHLQSAYELGWEAALASFEPSACLECEDTHNVECWCKCHFAEPSEAAAEPTCTCGADRTGPTAEAHAVNCPAEIEYNDH